MKKQAIDNYLLNYAEKQTMDAIKISCVYEFVIVIPICNESNDCLGSIFSEIDKSLSVLVICVVNSPQLNKNHKYEAQNVSFINSLLKMSVSNCVLSANSKLIKFKSSFDTLLINRNKDEFQIEDNFGVGLARKIGCDLALNLYQKGKVKEPWIFSTDADVILPSNYFKQIRGCSLNYSAVVLDFVHVSDDKLLNELQYYYDFKIRYYHSGITYAGSVYDYIPLGSTLISQMESYAQVRGFPKKNAGEDFYLLNKLAKIKPIAYNTNFAPIKIKSRFSQRVPFGTGPALMKINQLNSVDDYLYYHPKCFVLLKQWMIFLQSMWNHHNLIINPPDSKELKGLYEFLNCQKVFEKSKAQITSCKRWNQFVNQWFDAFKTLKAVHYFDKKFNKLNLKQLLKTLDFDKVSNQLLKNFISKHDKN